MQQLYSLVRQALDDYHMIEENDRIAIGISGGKDSLTLLYGLAGIRKFYPIPFQLTAVTVDLGYGDFDPAPIRDLCQKLQVPYEVVPTRISSVISGFGPSDSPCSVCAKMRKGALNDYILKLGCNKVAYAHHMDDIIETMLLSLLYEGRFYSFAPVTHLDKTGLTILRPLMYVPEASVKGFQNKYSLPVSKNPCPFDGHTKRAYVKQLLGQLNKENPGVKKRLFHSITTGNIQDWTLCTLHETSEKQGPEK